MFDLIIPDPNARVMQLFLDFDDIVEREVLKAVFDGYVGQKLKVKIMVAALRPEVVRHMATSRR